MAAKQSLQLEEGARIQLGEVDVTTKYDGVRRTIFTYFHVYSFQEIKDEYA